MMEKQFVTGCRIEMRLIKVVLNVVTHIKSYLRNHDAY